MPKFSSLDLYTENELKSTKHGVTNTGGLMSSDKLTI